MSDLSLSLPSYTLTPGEIEFVSRNQALLDLSLFDLKSIPNELDDASGEVVFSVLSDQGPSRLRPMSIQGSSSAERSESIHTILFNLKRWRDHGHKNLLPVHGFFASPEIPFITLASTYSRTTVLEYVRDHPNHNRLACCVQIAEGLDFLHRNSIIHGAIRGSNILVNEAGICVLGEFSSETVPSETTLSRYANWMAPELISSECFRKFLIDNYYHDYDGEFRMPSDVFAVGCTAIEIYTNTPPNVVRIPYSEVDTHKELAKLTREPTLIEQKLIPQRVLSAITSMLQIIPHLRPHSGNALKWLENPDRKRILPCSPVNAKSRLWQASRTKDI